MYESSSQTVVSSVRPSRRQPRFQTGRRPRAAVPLRHRLPGRGRFGHPGSSHAVVLPRQTRLREARRSRRLPRIRMHAVRASAGVRSRIRSVCGVADVQEESPLSLRSVWAPGAIHNDARRVPGVCVLLRPLVSQGDAGVGPDSPSRYLRAVRSLHPLRDHARRLRGIRLQELWTPVLLCL